MPVLPSQLPMPSNNRRHNEQIRRRLRKIEQDIDERSKHSERRWVAEKWQRRTIESTMNEVIINTLGVLDGHSFDRSDSSSYSLQTLYAKLFTPIDKVVQQETIDNGKTKETLISYKARIDEPIVKVLCEWAVSHQRFGEHRAMVVAWLMEKRQADIIAFDTQCSPEEAGIPAMYNGLPVFQRNLMEFLDFEAPVLEDNCSDQTRSVKISLLEYSSSPIFLSRLQILISMSIVSFHRIQFTNLVHLFNELIRHDVFSHDAYMSTLISRGEFLTMPLQLNDSGSTPSVGSSTMQPPTSSTLPPTTPASREDILPPTVCVVLCAPFSFVPMHSPGPFSWCI